MPVGADVSRSAPHTVFAQGRRAARTSLGIPGSARQHAVVTGPPPGTSTGRERDRGRGLPVFRGEEVLAVREDHVLHARLEHDRAHGPLLARAVPSPAPVRPACA